jgi:hypothetical protein
MSFSIPHENNTAANVHPRALQEPVTHGASASPTQLKMSYLLATFNYYKYTYVLDGRKQYSADTHKISPTSLNRQCQLLVA